MADSKPQLNDQRLSAALQAQMDGYRPDSFNFTRLENKAFIINILCYHIRESK
jgi:hypothetical protein